MVDTTIFILHYSDDNIHPALKVSNLALNEMLLRCVQSVKRNTTYPHKLVVVDNGSPEVGHNDAVNLLKENLLTPEFLWVQEDWHPVAVGANRAMDALETDYMAFITSDMKPGKNWLRHMIEPLKDMPWHMTACEPNITLYGIGNPKQYRTPAFWEQLRNKNTAENLEHYFTHNGVKYELDSYREPVPQCEPFIKEGNERISIFSASRDFIDKVGRYDEQFLRACEYQYYFQAIKRGVENPTSEASYTYLSHCGGLFRVGVGSYNPSNWKHHPVNPQSEGEDTGPQNSGKRGEYRYKRGAGNVLAVKDNLKFRKTTQGAEIIDEKTGRIVRTFTTVKEAIEWWEKN